MDTIKIQLHGKVRRLVASQQEEGHWTISVHFGKPGLWVLDCQNVGEEISLLNNIGRNLLLFFFVFCFFVFPNAIKINFFHDKNCYPHYCGHFSGL